MGDKLYLVCESCWSRLWEIDKNKLRAPFLASMLLPVAGIDVCWQPSAGQDQMLCPNCKDYVARKWNTIITTIGNTMKYEPLELHVPKIEKEDEPIEGKLTCPVCGGKFKKRGIKTHILYCKGKADGREEGQATATA